MNKKQLVYVYDKIYTYVRKTNARHTGAISIDDIKHAMSSLLTKCQNAHQLYAIGNINLLYKDCFAIIGTRKVTEYGKNNCEYFAKEIALRDIPIVSRNGCWNRWSCT